MKDRKIPLVGKVPSNKPPRPPADPEVLSAHIAATTAAYQVLVLAMERRGLLDRGEVAELLKTYMEVAKDRETPVTLALLHEMRLAVLDID